MSARNGDKARFGKQRKRKMAHRARTRDLRAGLQTNSFVPAAEGSGAEAQQGEHHGVLGSAAGAIGSVLGSLAAKVKTRAKSDPVAAE